MKQLLLSVCCCALAQLLVAQDLPVRTVTVFKNGRSLIQKAGKIPLRDGRYTLTTLPEALYGTFWVSAPGLQSVFAVQDSMDVLRTALGNDDILRKNLGKPLRIYVSNGNTNGYEPFDGVMEKVYDGAGGGLFVFRTTAGRWLTLPANEIHRFEFATAPELDFSRKKAVKRLEINFRSDQREADCQLFYLTEHLGWTPIYRLEMNGQKNGRLTLRAEIINDAEDLGNAGLRLAVGIPNFAFATRPSGLLNFPVRKGDGYNFIHDLNPEVRYDDNDLSNAVAYQQVSFNGNDGGRATGDTESEIGSQAEDFYYYTVNPGNFPQYSRYQYPIFETDIQPVHFYECVLPAAAPTSFSAYRDPRSAAEARHPVFHYIEFKNTTAFPWTTGVVNLLSQNDAGLQPVSQDLLPYTAPGATCKVRIAQTPEIKVTHAEGDVDRQENAKKFFSTTYDKVKIEAQVCVVNYGDAPVTLKVRRTLEGSPLSSQQPWTTMQEQATLRVNAAYTLEWIVELKPGEERKWTYGYEVFVNM